MPIYEYRCDDCGAEFEVFKKITDEAAPVCRECSSASVHRLISLSSFHLKGTGWYVTDYGGKKVDGARQAEEHKTQGHESEPAAGGGDSVDSADTGSNSSPETDSKSGSAVRTDTYSKKKGSPVSSST